MQAQHMPFTRLINVDQGAREHFHVPKYQREYAWKKWQWEQMLADIEDNDPGYFMGSIICVSDTKDITSGDELIFEVVDGQQRLTTLSLLLAAIFAKLQAARAGLCAADHQTGGGGFGRGGPLGTRTGAKALSRRADFA